MSQKQAKKRRREEKAKNQQGTPERVNGALYHDEFAVRDLEELLEDGNIDEYARVCWTLTNRMEELPKARDVITDFGPCEEHGSHMYRFRLTLQSMMTIPQCAGMETCGEAIKLVASKLPPEALPCYPHGHREQLQDYFMFGTKPHECSYCGETPNFTAPSKSVNWPGEAPVKGTDGQEYRTCPNCGSDMLEIQGDELDQWGWKIVCLDCDWEIKQAELLDVEQYCDLMEQTKTDLIGAIEIMESTSIGTETRINTAAVQTRKILEDIAYAALVSNKDTWNKPQEELKDLRSPRDIFRDIEKIPPNFFPPGRNQRAVKGQTLRDQDQRSPEQGNAPADIQGTQPTGPQQKPAGRTDRPQILREETAGLAGGNSKHPGNPPGDATPPPRPLLHSEDER